MSRLRPVAVGPGVVIILVAVAAAVGAYAVTRTVRDRPVAAVPSASSLPTAYVAAGKVPVAATVGPSITQPLSSGVAQQLRRVIAASGLGARVRARIVDMQSGVVLFDRGGAIPAAPASTAKLLLATALLAVRAPTDRLHTSVVSGARGTVVVVGAGDPTLTGAPSGRPASYAGAARISNLADQLKHAKVRPSRIIVDDGLFRGPSVSPAWAAGDAPSAYAAPITALLSDGGRASPDDAIRAAQPDLSAGHELADALGRRGLPVSRGRAAAGARVLATVSSAPLRTLIKQMLLESDNVIAECLGRQVAIAQHQPASFTGAATAIRTVLRRLGVDSGGGLVDASGLAARDRVTTAALVGVLRAADLTPRLRELFGALPVAAWSGTLSGRYLSSATRRGAGVVRAKTGTLSGVSALAGVVHDRSGALLGFALIADKAPSTPAAEAALDAVAAKLAGCGCR